MTEWIFRDIKVFRIKNICMRIICEEGNRRGGSQNRYFNFSTLSETFYDYYYTDHFIFMHARGARIR